MHRTFSGWGCGSAVLHWPSVAQALGSVPALPPSSKSHLFVVTSEAGQASFTMVLIKQVEHKYLRGKNGGQSDLVSSPCRAPVLFLSLPWRLVLQVSPGVPRSGVQSPLDHLTQKNLGQGSSLSPIVLTFLPFSSLDSFRPHRCGQENFPASWSSGLVP